MRTRSAPAARRGAAPETRGRPWAWRAALTLALVLSGVGCAPSTELIVVVEAEPGLSFESVSVSVEGGTPSALSVSRDDPDWRGLPVVLQVRQASGSESVRVEAIGVLRADEGASSLRAGGTASFVSGERRTVFLTLESACTCASPCVCDADESCCSRELPSVPYEPGGVVRDAGIDAGFAHCDNGIRDGDESDRDCGGSCDPCLVGDDCAEDGDCISQVCGASLRCLASECRNRVRDDGTETGVDCGGPCDACPVGEGCVLGVDCASGVCAAEVCRVETCADDELSGDESDVDCGGSCAPCVAGASCRTPTDCESYACRGEGICRDGCFAAFGGDCEDAVVTSLEVASAGGLGMVLEWRDDLLAVGAPGTTSGAVYLYRHDGVGDWTLLQTLSAPGVNALGSAIVLEDDEMLVRGNGAVARFTRTGDEWAFVGRVVTGLSAQPYDESAIARWDEWLAVSLPDNDFTVVLYRLVDGSWVETQRLVSQSPNLFGDDFGENLAFEDGVLFITADGESVSALDAGATYVFELVGETWTLTQLLESPSVVAIRNHFGTGVDYDATGDSPLLAIGEEREDLGADDSGGSSESGALHLFRRESTGSWEAFAHLKASNLDEEDHFGAGLALGGSALLAAGANDEDGPGTRFSSERGNLVSSQDSGAVYVFRDLPGLGWREVLYVKADIAEAGDRMGEELLIGPSTLVAGVPNANGGQGRVWIYEFPRSRTETCDGFDNDGDDEVDEAASVCDGCSDGLCP